MGGGNCGKRVEEVKAPPLKRIAGSLDIGAEGPIAELMLLNRADQSLIPDLGSLVVSTQLGVLYFRDRGNGIYSYSLADRKLKLVVRVGAEATGDNGDVTKATLKDPVKIGLDGAGRLLVLDYNRIRRIDTLASPMTIETVAGGGTNANTGPMNATDLLIQPPPTGVGARAALPFVVLPRGDVYFQAERYSGNGDAAPSPRYRLFTASTNRVSTSFLTGTGTSVNGGQNVTQCTGLQLGVAFNPGSSLLTAIQGLVSCGGTPASANIPIPGDTPAQPTNESADSSITFSYRFTGRDGELYAVSRLEGSVRRYERDTRTWTAILQAGVARDCGDGSAGVLCQADLVDAAVGEDGTLYFIDHGKLRYLDNAGLAQTMFGANLASGDGADALKARFNSVSRLDVRPTGEILAFDRAEHRIREFSVGGAIRTVAGNGLNGLTDLSGTAVSQPLMVSTVPGPYWDSLAVDGKTGDLFTASVDSRGPRILRLPRRGTQWLGVAGGGGLPYAGTEGVLGTDLSFNTPPRLIAVSGTQVLAAVQSLGLVSYDSYLKAYELTNFTQRGVAGVGGGATATGLCNDGVAGIGCAIPPAGGDSVVAGFDAGRSRWLLLVKGTDTIRTIASGGAFGTLVRLSKPAVSFAFRRGGGKESLFYCDTSGRLHAVRDNADTELPWNEPEWKCGGSSLLFHEGRASLVFPFLSRGAQGIGEYSNP